MRAKCSPGQIRAALRALDRGTPIAVICRRLGIARSTLSRWRDAAVLSAENRRLRRRLRALAADKLMLQYILKRWP